MSKATGFADASDSFRVLYETSRDAIMTLDPERGFLSGNHATLALFGCATEEEFSRLSPAKISPELQPDGRRSDDKAAEMIGIAMREGSHFFEWVHARTDGGTFWAEVLLTRFEIGGRSIIQATVRDISDRKRAEEEIRKLNAELERRAADTAADFIETNNRLRQLIDGASDAVVTIDAGGSVIDWNPAAEAIFGWTKEEAIGQLMHMLVVPERMREAHRTGLARFVATGQGRITHRTIEIKALHRDGREFDVELAIWPVRSGDTYTFSAFLRDISERKRTAEMLEQRAARIGVQRDVLVRLAGLDKSDFDGALEEILRTSATTLHVERASFWIISQDRSEIVCHRLYRRSSDAFSKDEVRLCSTDFPDYFEAISSRRSLAVDDARNHPATRAFTSSYLDPQNISALLDATVWIHGQPLGVVCHEQVGGSRSWQAEEIDFASSIATMISLASESSERVEAQRRLIALQEDLRNTLAEREAILENSGVGIAFLRDDRFVWVNQTLGAMTGRSREELVGRPPEFLGGAGTPDCGDWLQHALNTLATGAPVRTEREFPAAGGATMWSRVSARCINPGIPDLGSIWTIEDISERVRAEEEIRLALERARELNDLKTRFVAMTSHEFRTPLSTILSSAELLEHYSSRMPPEECAELWKSISSAVRRMTEMLDDVLVIGRSDAGEFDLKVAPLELRDLCDCLVAEFRRSLPDGIELDYTAPEPGLRPLDEKLLRHILVNLLSNAIKYSPSGGRVRFEVHTDPDQSMFLISDEGIGIPKSDQPRLFETFHRATNVGNISGTGLGLAIVKKSVDQHSGTIEVDSSEGQGTTFTIRIPHGAWHGKNPGD